MWGKGLGSRLLGELCRVCGELVAAFELLLDDAFNLAVSLGGVGKGFRSTSMGVATDATPLADKAVFAEKGGLDAN